MERQVMRAVADVVRTIRTRGAIKATRLVTDSLTVKASLKRHRHGKMPTAADRRRSETIVLTIGRPNYHERQLLKASRKAGQSAPARGVLMKFQPKR